jgi:hypothetical protein
LTILVAMLVVKFLSKTKLDWNRNSKVFTNITTPVKQSYNPYTGKLGLQQLKYPARIPPVN